MVDNGNNYYHLSMVITIGNNDTIMLLMMIMGMIIALAMIVCHTQ